MQSTSIRSSTLEADVLKEGFLSKLSSGLLKKWQKR
jgi:hypothetical protein